MPTPERIARITGVTGQDGVYLPEFENAARANPLSAFAAIEARNQIYAVAAAGRTTLDIRFVQLRDDVVLHGADPQMQPTHCGRTRDAN